VSAGATVPFKIEPVRGVVLRGKARREGQLWTLTLDGHGTEAGYDLVKTQQRLTDRIRKTLAAR
jgi:hypothetical protein